MSNKKISELATVSYKGNLVLPAVDMTLPTGTQNVKVLASSLQGGGGFASGQPSAPHNLDPSRHLSNLYGLTSAVVAIIGDSTATAGPDQSGIAGGAPVANGVDASQMIWGALQDKLQTDNPQISTWTFKNFAIGGTAENAPLFTGDQFVNRPDWFVDTTRTWLSYVQEAAPDVLFWLFGTNASAAGVNPGQSTQTFIRQCFEVINGWAKVPNVIIITNKSSNPATDTTPGPDDMNSSNHKAQAAFHRTFAQTNASGYTSFPLVAARGFGLIDLGRYFTCRVDGHDPVIQYLQARPDFLTTGKPLGVVTTTGTDASTIGTTTHGDFRITFVLRGAGGDTLYNYGGSNAIKVTVSKFVANYLRLVIFPGGLIRAFYILDGALIASPTQFGGTTVTTTNGQDVVITVACSGPNVRVTINGTIAMDIAAPRLITEAAGGTPINVGFASTPTGIPKIDVTEFYEGIGAATPITMTYQQAFGTVLQGNATNPGFQGGNSINHQTSLSAAEDRKIIMALDFAATGNAAAAFIGPTGPAGLAGATGPSGPAGPTGPQGLAGVGLKNRGSWVSGTLYAPNDYVFDTGITSPSSMWIMKGTTNYTSTTQPKTDLTHWVEYTAPPGPTGPTGQGFPEAPLDTKSYGRSAAAWVPVLPITGGTLTGTGNNLTANTVATGSTAARSLQNRAADWVNVMDFGAKLDGVTNDNAAYAAARAATPVNGSIVVPRGRQMLTVAPTTGPAGSVLWKYDGNLAGLGSSFVVGIGTDLIESFIGSKYWARAHSYPACPPLLRADLTIDHSGGSAANVLAGQQVNVTTSATSTAAEAVTGIGAILQTHAATGGNNVALIGYSIRAADAGRVAMTGANIYAKDQSGGTSGVHGPLVGMELNVIANDLDDGGSSGAFYAPSGEGIRILLLCTAAKEIAGGADAEIGWGVNVTSHPGVTYRRMYSALGPFSKAAFSTEFAIQNAGANAIWLADGHRIAFDKAGTHALSYETTGTPRLRYMVGATERWSINDTGGMILAGTGPITGFGTAIGQALGPLVSSGGANLPMLSTGNRLIFRRATTASTDSTDFQFDRTTTYSGGSGINRVIGVNFTVGATTTADEHGLIVVGQINTTGGTPSHYGIWSQMARGVGSTGHCTGIVSNIVDQTGLATAAARVPNLCGIEIEVYANGIDDALNPGTFGGAGVRKLIHLGWGKTNPGSDQAIASTAIWITTGGGGTSVDPDGTHSSFSQAIGFGVGSRILSALDTRGILAPIDITDPVAAVRMQAEQIIDFNGATVLRGPPGNYLQYTLTGTDRLRYVDGANEIWSIDDTGAMIVAGTLTANGSATIGTSTAAANLVINGPAASLRRVLWQTAGSSRWSLHTNTTTESGANAGSDLDLQAFSDTAASLNILMRITRSTGAISIDPNHAYPNQILLSNGMIQTNSSFAQTGTHTLTAGVPIAAGGQSPAGIWQLLNWTGSVTTNPVSLNFIDVIDTVNVSSDLPMLRDLNLTHIYQAGAIGSRCQFSLAFDKVAASADNADTQCFNLMAFLHYDVCESTTAGTYKGRATVVNFDGRIGSNNGFVRTLCIQENDLRAFAGNSVLSKGNISLHNGIGDAIHGVDEDYSLCFSSSPTVLSGTGGNIVLMQLGAVGSSWPLDPARPDTAILRVGPNNTNGRAGNLQEACNLAVGVGFDLYGMNFGTAALRTVGLTIDGNGQVPVIGPGSITYSTSGLQIDVPNIREVAATIAAGGSSYRVNDTVWDTIGGLWKVTTISGTGVVGPVTAVSLVKTGYSSSPPTNPVATTGGNGTGLTLTVTTAVTGTLTLNPSGDTIIGKGLAGAIGDTKGHLLIPFVSGTPTGVPANASKGIALRYDTSAHKLWVFDTNGNTWRGIVLT